MSHAIEFSSEAGRADAVRAIRQQTESDLLRSMEPFGRTGKIWIGSLLSVIAIGLVAYTIQIVNGLVVTGLREYVSWGVYMTNFVFFIGVSHAGTLISAILRVTDAEWRRPITRMAEAITVFALLVGAPMVIIDMGRPDRIHHVFLYGRLQSPILWDLLSIATYIAGSLLYLYVAMIPDLGILAGLAGDQTSRRARFYRLFSLGYRDTPAQRKFLNRALVTMAVIIIPVAVSVHTVVSWIFGMTLRAGWHSTIFGPYFVIGAIFSGTAAIITAMAVFRRAYGLQSYLTYRHFRSLGTLLLTLNLLYIYFTLSEYLTAWYGSEEADKRLIELLMGGTAYGTAFWAWVAGGLFVPLVLLAVRSKRSITPIVIASVLINIGMWVKRYLIIVPTMLTPYIPPEAAGAVAKYMPTWIEWAVTAGGLAFFLLLYTLFSKLVPIVSPWETMEGVEEVGVERTGLDVQFFRPHLVGRASLCIVGLLALSGSALAQEAARPSITLEPSVEEGKKVLLATVTLETRPVEGAQVVFYAKRTFGRIKLGQEETLDDGTAIAPFPDGLPGDQTGKIDVTAEIVAPEQYAGAKADALVDGGVRVIPHADPFPRALWSPRAPIPMLVIFAVLLGGVWSTYLFVLYQLFRIRKDGTPP